MYIEVQLISKMLYNIFFYSCNCNRFRSTYKRDSSFLSRRERSCARLGNRTRHLHLVIFFSAGRIRSRILYTQRNQNNIEGDVSRIIPGEPYIYLPHLLGRNKDHDDDDSVNRCRHLVCLFGVLFGKEIARVGQICNSTETPIRSTAIADRQTSGTRE